MDLNTAGGIIAIRKSDYTLQAIRGSKQDYFSNAEYWLYNAGNVPKYRTTQIDVSEARDGSEMVDTAAMKKGIDNLLQVGDLPQIAGVIQPVKYWRTTLDGNLDLKGPAARTAADDAETLKATRRARKAHVEQRISHHERRTARRNAAQTARTAGDITQAELDAVNAEG